MISKRLIEELSGVLGEFPSHWDGRTAIGSMKNEGSRQWRQMEWIGWYFQHLCETRLSNVLEIPGSRYGRVSFDGFAEIPWDFKAHPERNSKGKTENQVIVNDKVAIESALEQYGEAGLILAIGEAAFDDAERGFQLWHQEFKGGQSAYEKERELRQAPSRLRKTGFNLKEIQLILLNQETLRHASPFQKGFRNSNGNPRNEKVKIELNLIEPFKTIVPKGVE